MVWRVAVWRVAVWRELAWLHQREPIVTPVDPFPAWMNRPSPSGIPVWVTPGPHVPATETGSPGRRLAASTGVP